MRNNLRYLARDQWGRTIFLLTKFPRQELLKNMGKKHASKMYVDKISGPNKDKSFHVGYVIGGHWWTLYRIEPVENPA